MPLLCHQAPIGRHHVEAVRGFSGAYLGLGGVLLPQSVCAVVGHDPPVPERYWPSSVAGSVPVCAPSRAHVRQSMQENKSETQIPHGCI